MLTTSYPRYPGDPAGSFVHGLASWLASTGDSVEVLAPEPARADPAAPGVSVRPLRAAPGLFFGAGAPDNLQRAPAWAEVPPFVLALGGACRSRSASWDAMVSHWLLPSGVIASLCGRGRPHLAVAHSSDVHLLVRLGALAPLLLRGLARSRTRLLLTSEALRPLLVRLARGRAARRLVEDARVQRMGIPPAAAITEEGRVQARAALGIAADARLLLCLARLVPVKGIDDLLRACAGEPLELAVVGEGPEREALVLEATRLGARARFAGEQIGAAKLAWLAAADLLVLPSRVLADGRTESAPLVLLEAMAAGLPVVATRVGGNAELIHHGENGLLVEPGDPAGLRRALRGLLDDPALGRRLAAAGRQTAASHTWDRVGARLRALLVEPG